MVAGKPFYGGSRYGPNGMSRVSKDAAAFSQPASRLCAQDITALPPSSWQRSIESRYSLPACYRRSRLSEMQRPASIGSAYSRAGRGCIFELILPV